MTYLTQSYQELKSIFSTMPIEVLTKHMNAKEIEITRQQKYIAKCGEENDKTHDEIWESYKVEAEDNLLIWDAMKAARDEMK